MRPVDGGGRKRGLAGRGVMSSGVRFWVLVGDLLPGLNACAHAAAELDAGPAYGDGEREGRRGRAFLLRST